MAAIVKAIKEYWDEMLAVGVGIVITDVVGDQVRNFLEPIIGNFISADWMDAVTELLIGVGILAIGEMAIPIKYKAYTRLAAFGAIGIGVANVVSTAIAGFAPAGARAPRTVVARARPAVTVRRPTAARPTVAPEIFS